VQHGSRIDFRALERSGVLQEQRITTLALPEGGHRIFLRPNTPDKHVFDAIFKKRELNHGVRGTAKFIVDAGAYIGLSSVFFATQHPDATIIAIEPENANFQLLLKNTAAWPAIIPLQAALWWEDTELALYDPGTQEWGYQVFPSGTERARKQHTPGISILSLMNRFGGKHIDILKLDVEGAELEVLQNSRAWIASVDVLIIELHDGFRKGCRDAFLAATRNFDHSNMGAESIVCCRR
jgi:FkbM family methyltransferase